MVSLIFTLIRTILISALMVLFLVVTVHTITPLQESALSREEADSAQIEQEQHIPSREPAYAQYIIEDTDDGDEQEETLEEQSDDIVQESASQPPEESQQAAQTIVANVQEPLYTTPPLQFETINTMTLPALVNILCASKQGSNIPGATGSGIIIDPRGVILTNAHVAQYILLAQHSSTPVSCVVRIGAPAKPRFTADVLAFPRVWAEQHAKDILTELPTGTGEHDWALLYITGTTSGVPKPDTFPFISFDTRHAVTQTHDPVLLASYPAGFLGSIALRKDLWPVSTIVSIQKVFTFTQGIIDVLSLGGNIAAQGGSSGGAVVNQWGHVVGLIVTSSLGDTTAERDLRAVTLSHIEQSLRAQIGEDLLPFLQQGDFENRVQTFKANSLPYLLEYYSL